MIDGYKIYDAHMHVIGRFKKRDESLPQFLDRFGIDRAVITSLNQAANLSTILKSEGNENQSDFIESFVPKGQYDHEIVRQAVKEHPDRLTGIFWFNPRIATEEDWKLLKIYIKEYNFKAVKTQCYLDLLEVPEDLYSIAEFCIEHDVPLFLHSGSGFFFQKSVRANDYYSLFKKYKELKCVILHAAFTMEYCINCLKYFNKLENIYFETSVSIPYGIMTLIKAMGSHRVLYGSDAPAATSPDIEIDKIRILNLDNQTLENVFYNNISRLFGEEP